MTPHSRREVLQEAARYAITVLEGKARRALDRVIRRGWPALQAGALDTYADCMSRRDQIEADILSDEQHRHPLVNQFIEE